MRQSGGNQGAGLAISLIAGRALGQTVVRRAGAMAEKAHSLRVSDEIWDWLKARAATKGSSIAEEIEALCRHVRAEEASGAVQATAGPALRDALSEAMKERLAELAQMALPVLETLTLEAM